MRRVSRKNKKHIIDELVKDSAKKAEYIMFDIDYYDEEEFHSDFEDTIFEDVESTADNDTGKRYRRSNGKIDFQKRNNIKNNKDLDECYDDEEIYNDEYDDIIKFKKRGIAARRGKTKNSIDYYGDDYNENTEFNGMDNDEYYENIDTYESDMDDEEELKDKKILFEYKRSHYKKLKDKKSDYQKFFSEKLKKRGIKSPAELNDDEKKKFFEEVSKEWDEEKNKQKTKDKKQFLNMIQQEEKIYKNFL